MSYSKAVARRCSVKKVFLEIHKIHRKTPVPETLFSLLKKRLWNRCFPVNFTKFLRTPCLTKHLRWLLLVTSILKKIFEKWKHLEIKQDTQKLSYTTTISFCQKIKNFDFEGLFHLSERGTTGSDLNRRWFYLLLRKQLLEVLYIKRCS